MDSTVFLSVFYVRDEADLGTMRGRELLPVMCDEITAIIQRMNQSVKTVCKAHNINHYLSEIPPNLARSTICLLASRLSVLPSISSIWSTRMSCNDEKHSIPAYNQPPMAAYFRRAGLYLLVPHGSPNALFHPSKLQTSTKRLRHWPRIILHFSQIYSSHIYLSASPLLLTILTSLLAYRTHATWKWGKYIHKLVITK